MGKILFLYDIIKRIKTTFVLTISLDKPNWKKKQIEKKQNPYK